MHGSYDPSSRQQQELYFDDVMNHARLDCDMRIDRAVRQLRQHPETYASNPQRMWKMTPGWVMCHVAVRAIDCRAANLAENQARLRHRSPANRDVRTHS